MDENRLGKAAPDVRVRSLRETASHINVDHVERILRGLEPTQPAGRAAQRRRTSRCPFRKDTQLFKRTQGFSRLTLLPAFHEQRRPGAGSDGARATVAFLPFSRHLTARGRWPSFRPADGRVSDAGDAR